MYLLRLPRSLFWQFQTTNVIVMGSGFVYHPFFSIDDSIDELMSDVYWML